MNAINTQWMTPPEAAACLLFYLEARGAVVTMGEDDLFRIDLNPVADIDSHQKAERISHALLSLRDEIRQILIARRGPAH